MSKRQTEIADKFIYMLKSWAREKRGVREKKVPRAGFVKKQKIFLRGGGIGAAVACSEMESESNGNKDF